MTPTSIPPHALASALRRPWSWRSTFYASRVYGRTERLMRRWCSTGVFACVGIPVYQASDSRWWIALDDDDFPSAL
jgi:hypothetical protein